MGPRSFDRGKDGAMMPAIGQMMRFNGAAVIRPRTDGGLGIYTKANEASMGPRSFDRGKLMLALNMLRAIRFNGAAVIRPRKGGARSAGRKVDGRASMGPRSFDRGKDKL